MGNIMKKKMTSGFKKYSSLLLEDAKHRWRPENTVWTQFSISTGTELRLSGLVLSSFPTEPSSRWLGYSFNILTPFVHIISCLNALHLLE